MITTIIISVLSIIVLVVSYKLSARNDELKDEKERRERVDKLYWSIRKEVADLGFNVEEVNSPIYPQTKLIKKIRSQNDIQR